MKYCSTRFLSNLNMVRTTHVLIASAIVMLASSVMVAAVALIFHPTKSEPAIILANLRPKLQRALKEAGLDSDEDVESDNAKTLKQVAPVDCKLTEARKEQIRDIVEQAIKDETVNQNIEILKQTMHKDAETKNDNNTILKKIENLSLNVPKPSAHWFLKDQPEYKGGQGNIPRDVNKWVWQTANEVAHTQNGIEHDKGKMKITVEGWYQIYTQLDFQTNLTKEEDMKFTMTVSVTRNRKAEELPLLTAKDSSKCQHNHHKFHTCTVLTKSGMFKLFQDDLLRVRVSMPDKPTEVSVDTDMSRSYFGAHFVHHYPWPE